jgi:hypothetical protein
MMDNLSDRMKLADAVAAGLIMNSKVDNVLKLTGTFACECIRDGKVLWEEEFENVVTDQGKKAILDTFFNLAAAYAAIRLGLHTTVGSGTSLYATPTPQVESTVYSGNRGTPTFAAASGVSTVSKATSGPVAFNITGSATITGAFACLGATANLNTPGDTATAAAILFSSGSFGTSRAVISGDTLNVTYSIALT